MSNSIFFDISNKISLKKFNYCIFLSLIFITFFDITLSYSQQGVEFKHYSNDDGLSQSSAVSIIQDRNGFVWIGTQDGLNRFDGYSFKIFRNDPGDNTSLSDNFIRSIIEDSNGNIWIGTNGGGLNRYNSSTESFESFQHQYDDSESLNSDGVFAILEHSNGDLWVGTDKGLALFDVQSRKFEHFIHDINDSSSISSNKILSLFEDSEGTLWIGTHGEGLVAFDYHNKSFKSFKHPENGLSSNYEHIVRSIYEDSKGNFWIGTEGGLKLFDRDKSKYDDSKSYLNDSMITCIEEDINGNLWVGTGFNGLARFDYDSQTFDTYKHSSSDKTSISGNRIVSMINDQHGNMWIGTYGNGINFFDYRNLSFGRYQHLEDDPNSLSYNFVRTFFEEDNGNFWVGTEGGGLNYFDIKNKTVKHYLNSSNDPGSISNNNIRCLAQDDEGNLWIGTNGGGLNVFDPKTQSFKHFKQNEKDSTSINSDIIYSLLNDSKGNIWVGTARGGLNKYNYETRTFDHFIHSDDDTTSLEDNTVWTLLEDSKGNIWVGTWDGLDRFDPRSNTFQHFNNSKENNASLSHNFTKSIYEDSKGRLWIGTFAGLNLFMPESGTFKRYGKKEGLSNEVIYGILEDEAGNIWISTNSGINKFDPESETFTLFTSEDGLQGNEFNTGAYHMGGSGILYFGGPHGFNAFQPENISDDKLIPPVVLTDFLLFNKPVAINDTSVLHQSINEIKNIVLNHNDFIFGFEFSGLNYSQLQQNQFAYKLDGFDKDWTTTDYQYRRATYTNIPPGDYVFKVVASNDGGLWNKEGISVNVAVLPPWWLTWWAKALYGIVPVLLFIIIYGVRVSLLEKQKARLEEQVKSRTNQIFKQKEELYTKNKRLVNLNIEKDEILGVVAHDLRAPLGRINGLSQLIIMAGQISPQQLNYIDKINISIAQGNQLIDDLLDVHHFEQEILKLNVEEINISEFLLELEEHFNIHAEKKKQQLSFKSVKGSIQTNKLLLCRLLENLLSNAIKFSPVGKPIVISASKEDDKYLFSIKDEGPGFTVEDKEKMFVKFQKLSAQPTGDEGSTGLGLSIVKVIIDRLQGAIEVRSELGVGSEFIIALSDIKNGD